VFAYSHSRHTHILILARLELNGFESKRTGSDIPIQKLQGIVTDMMRRIDGKGSCVLPSVLDDPYFMN
jgi:hypothetical protein